MRSRALCEVDNDTGCWSFTRRTTVACRANGDTRGRSDLPKSLPHRWVWAVANRRVGNPLSSNAFQIRRRCGNPQCCNPEHLYAALSNGREATVVEEVDEGNKSAQSSNEIAGSENPWEPHITKSPADLPNLVAKSANIDVVQPQHESEHSTVSAEGMAVPTSPASSSTIRRSYASWISANCPALIEAADSLALAIHPWPDFPINQLIADAVVAEMHPLASLPHPDICEVAAERLLRIVDIASELECPRLAAACLEAASKLDSLPLRAPHLVKACTDVVGPLLSGRVNWFPASGEAITADHSLSPADNWDDADVVEIWGDEDAAQLLGTDHSAPAALSINAVSALLPKIASTASRDLGVLLGGDPVGFDVCELINCSPDLAVVGDFAKHLAALPERDRDIVVERHFNLDRPPTLDTLGDRWGITRERARQIARKAEQDIETEFGEKFCTLAEHVLGPLHNRAVPTNDLFELASLVAPEPSSSRVVVAALIKADGTWMHDDGWSMTATEAGKLAASLETLMELADGYWSLSREDAHRYLIEHFLRPDHLENYLSERLGWVPVRDRWSLTGSKRNRIATALRAIGRPATKAEIAHAAGIKEINQISNHLGNIPDVVRADKDRWAFAGWVEDPYDGIVGEIEQRIDEHGGAVSLALLLEEIPARFGVSVSSVRTFVATDAFVLDHGMVRRNEADYLAGDPAYQLSATRVGDLWGQRVLLHQRHFEGYSLAASFDVAYANGVRPGDDLLVPVAGSDDHASLIWQRHNPSRTVFVGRISNVLADLGCSAGDGIVLVPCKDAVQIVFEHQPFHAGTASVIGETPRIDVARAPTPSVVAFETPEHASPLVRDPLLDLLGDG